MEDSEENLGENSPLQESYLIFRSKIRSPDAERICIRMSSFIDKKISPTTDKGGVRYPEKVSITRLDENCQSTSSQKSKQVTENRCNLPTFKFEN